MEKQKTEIYILEYISSSLHIIRSVNGNNITDRIINLFLLKPRLKVI